jgi:hypothetical protein
MRAVRLRLGGDALDRPGLERRVHEADDVARRVAEVDEEVEPAPPLERLPCAPAEDEELRLGHGAVGDDDRLPVARLEGEVAPADLGHLPDDVADLHPVALLDRVLPLEDDPADGVAERALDRQADDRAEHGRAGEDPLELDPRAREGRHGDDDVGEAGDEVAEDRPAREADRREDDVEQEDREEVRRRDAHGEVRQRPQPAVGLELHPRGEHAAGGEGDQVGEEEEDARADPPPRRRCGEADEGRHEDDPPEEDERPVAARLGQGVGDPGPRARPRRRDRHGRGRRGVLGDDDRRGAVPQRPQAHGDQGERAEERDEEDQAAHADVLPPGRPTARRRPTCPTAPHPRETGRAMAPARGPGGHLATTLGPR